MSIDVILALTGSVFLIMIGITVGLSIGEHGSRTRTRRQARYQQQLNVERARLNLNRIRLDELESELRAATSGDG